ncbi:MAG: hypothetical protein K1X67_13115 [Fimbriimonadaceae bacterium]|nr:hypothetical protein [Fimbriimonadaceae bacterium]
MIRVAEENNFDFLREVAETSSSFVVRCRNCQRVSATRAGPLAKWGCTCSRNLKSASYGGRASKQPLLRESPESRPFKWWDHERNKQSDFDTVSLNGTRVCNWICGECGYRFKEKVSEVHRYGMCPQCRARRHEEFEKEYERWKNTAVSDVPELAAAWADDEEDPRLVMVAGSGHYRFRCANGHYPRINPYTFLESGCPSCRGLETKSNPLHLADLDAEVASQWHPKLNGKRTPQNVVYNSKVNAWWRSDCCGYEWQEPVRDRNKYQRWRCPQCRTILDSLAWHDPGLAAEWSPKNPLSAWKVRPSGSTAFIPEWICSINPAHVWEAPLASRSSGAECPECRETGKSRIELDHHAAAIAVFGEARSGVVLRDEAFTWRAQWSVDISVEVKGRMVVIEYDGAYWHSPEAKRLIDERKTRDLLAAGYVVVRLREDGLAPLEIEDSHYREVRVYSSIPQPVPVMREVLDWVGDL